MSAHQTQPITVSNSATTLLEATTVPVHPATRYQAARFVWIKMSALMAVTAVTPTPHAVTVKGPIHVHVEMGLLVMDLIAQVSSPL